MKHGSIRITVPKAQLQTAMQKELTAITGDTKAAKATNKIFVEMCNKYVPYETGALQAAGRYTEKSAIWDTEYAHYMYEGIIYGPNIPIYAAFKYYGLVPIILGWYSPKGKKKYPTNRKMTYHLNGNPLASRHWDEKMLQRDRKAFNLRVTNELKRIASKKKKK